MNQARSNRRLRESERSRPTRRQFVQWMAALTMAGGCGRNGESDAGASDQRTDPPSTDPSTTAASPAATPTDAESPTTQPIAPPTLSISTPEGARFCQIYLSEPDPLACEQVASAAVPIEGSVTPGAEVSVDNQPAVVEGDTWSARVPVAEGLTTITATATNAAGTTTASVQIEYREFERSDW